MATATAARPSIADAYRAAILRARDEGLSAERNADGTWTVKSYVLTFVGPRWHDITCTCQAGQHGRVCKHAAIVVFARKYHGCRVTFKGKEAAAAASTDVAQSLAVQAEIAHEIGALPIVPANARAYVESCAAEAAYYDEMARSHTLEPGSTRIKSDFDYYDAA